MPRSGKYLARAGGLKVRERELDSGRQRPTRFWLVCQSSVMAVSLAWVSRCRLFL